MAIKHNYDGKTFLIYKITNRNNGKSYIGFTVYDIEHRWKRHISCARRGSKFRFHSAIRKHGVHSWEKNILIDNIPDIETAKRMEEEYILQFNTHMNGYNATTGGTGGFVVKDIEKWKQNRPSFSGEKNGRYSGLTDEDIVNLSFVSLRKRNFTFIPGMPTLRKFLTEDGTPIPKTFSEFRFEGKGIKGFQDKLKEFTGMELDQFWDRKIRGKSKNANKN